MNAKSAYEKLVAAIAHHERLGRQLDSLGIGDERTAELIGRVGEAGAEVEKAKAALLQCARTDAVWGAK